MFLVRVVNGRSEKAMKENDGWSSGGASIEAHKDLMRGKRGGRTTSLMRSPGFGRERRMSEDGCEQADRVMGYVSSCFECPFKECEYQPKCYMRGDRRPRAEIIDGFPFISGVGGIRPLLKENDLDLIMRALREYSVNHPGEKETILVFLHRIFKEKVFFPGKWFKKDWDSSRKFI